MTTARVIVCEQSGQWAVALRRALETAEKVRLAPNTVWERLASTRTSGVPVPLLPQSHLTGAPIRVFETRSLSDCWQELTGWPASFLALELTEGNVEQIVEFFSRLARWYPNARAVVVARREMQAYQWLLREAGAAATIFSPRHLAPLARLLRRHAASAPTIQMSRQQRIMASLPWARAARGVGWGDGP